MEEDITGFWANCPEVRARVGIYISFWAKDGIEAPPFPLPLAAGALKSLLPHPLCPLIPLAALCLRHLRSFFIYPLT